MKNKLILKDISLTSIFLSLVFLLNVISAFFPVLFGYSIDLYLIFFALGLIIINNLQIRILFFIIVPFFLMLAPNVYFINIYQVILEYFIAVWCFFPFLFGKLILDHWKWENNKWTIWIFGGMFILSWMLKLIAHLIAGYLWWVPNDWLGSFLINMPIIFLNSLITIPIFIIIFLKIIKISKTYYLRNGNY